MTYVPLEMVLADAISMLFLTLGAVFLIRFFLKFGSKKSKIYSIFMCVVIISFAIFHEGLEVIHGLYDLQNFEMQFLIISVLLTTSYFAAAVLLKKEITSLLSLRRKKDGD
ncbi:MAG: hypothetical protein V1818_03015 [Candidatus Aenigmatarchaeota archaeon]